MPIHFVIAEQVRGTPLAIMYGMWIILKVFACDIEDIDYLYKKEVAPLQQNSRPVSTFIFIREVENPFKEKAEEPIWLA